MPSDIDFQDLLTTLDEGTLHNALGNAARNCTKAARDTGKASVLTLKLTFKPEGRAVVVSAKHESKLPTNPVASTMFYDDDAGNLHETDPRQLPIKEVILRPPTPLRTVGEKKE